LFFENTVEALPKKSRFNQNIRAGLRESYMVKQKSMIEELDTLNKKK